MEVTEIFGDGERQIRRLAAHQRRLVRGRYHHDRTRQTRRAEVVLQKFLHFAAAFADQTDDETSAATLRASIDKSTDLPTPEPENMPMRWPRQTVRNVLSARTPRSRGAPTRMRACAGGGEERNG
jgi:hypothetical protein